MDNVFEVVAVERGTFGVISILVDKATGVQYICANISGVEGITPRLRSNGEPFRLDIDNDDDMK